MTKKEKKEKRRKDMLLIMPKHALQLRSPAEHFADGSLVETGCAVSNDMSICRVQDTHNTCTGTLYVIPCS